MRLKYKNVERTTDSEAAAARLMQQGYEVMESKLTAPAETVSPVLGAAELDKMSLQALRALAKENDIPGADALGKKDLLDLLKDVV